MKKKMTISLFAEKMGWAVSTFSRALRGERNLSHDKAVKVARALRTNARIWEHDLFLMDRVSAWSGYLEKFNGGKP